MREVNVAEAQERDHDFGELADSSGGALSWKALVLPEYLSQIECYSDDARAIVLEPIVDLPDLWCEIPESTFVTIDGEQVYRDSNRSSEA